MSQVADDIYHQLSEDMVSHGWLVQSFERAQQSPLEWKSMLKDLLSRDVEIGVARLASSGHVEFVAWPGQVDDRVSRAEERVKMFTTSDQEFAYWLALRKNVDHVETEG